MMQKKRNRIFTSTDHQVGEKSIFRTVRSVYSRNYGAVVDNYQKMLMFKREKNRIINVHYSFVNLLLVGNEFLHP